MTGSAVYKYRWGIMTGDMSARDTDAVPQRASWIGGMATHSHGQTGIFCTPNAIGGKKAKKYIAPAGCMQKHSHYAYFSYTSLCRTPFSPHTLSTLSASTFKRDNKALRLRHAMISLNEMQNRVVFGCHIGRITKGRSQGHANCVNLHVYANHKGFYARDPLILATVVQQNIHFHRTPSPPAQKKGKRPRVKKPTG